MREVLVPFVAALFGGAFQEIVHWYELRARLEEKKYRLLLRSGAYWTVTILMTVGSAIGCVLWKWEAQSNYSAFDFVVLGAAFPLIFKKVVQGAGAAVHARHLGEPDEAKTSWMGLYFFGEGSP